MTSLPVCHNYSCSDLLIPYSLNSLYTHHASQHSYFYTLYQVFFTLLKCSHEHIITGVITVNIIC